MSLRKRWYSGARGVALYGNPRATRGRLRLQMIPLLFQLLDEEDAARWGRATESSKEDRCIVSKIHEPEGSSELLPSLDLASAHLVSRNLSTQLARHASCPLAKLVEMPPVEVPRHLSQQSSVKWEMDDCTRALACSESRNCCSSDGEECEASDEVVRKRVAKGGA